MPSPHSTLESTAYGNNASHHNDIDSKFNKLNVVGCLRSVCPKPMVRFGHCPTMVSKGRGRMTALRNAGNSHCATQTQRRRNCFKPLPTPLYGAKKLEM